MMRLLQGYLKFLAKALKKNESRSITGTDRGGGIDVPVESLFQYPKVEDLDQKELEVETGKGSKSVEQSPLVREGRSPALIRRRSQTVFIQVGLDFGTSSTKIVYSQLGGRLARAVVFDHRLPTYPCFCLPSVAAINAQGKLLLGIEAAHLLADEPWDSGLRRFKVVVAGKHDANFCDSLTEKTFCRYVERRLGAYDALSPEQITAIYLAYAMNQARRAIQSAPEYKNYYDLDLSFNVCMPISHIQNSRVRPVFEHILGWAEAIEMEWVQQGDAFNPLEFSQRIEEEVSYGAKDPESFERSDPNARVFAVPEAVAEAASYLISLQRQEGLHAIVDFGAGTTDISIFNLRDVTRGLKCYWYAAENIPRGATNIERIIATHLKESNGKTSSCTSREVIGVVQQLGSESIALTKNIRKELYELRELTHDVWHSAYCHLKKESSWHCVQVFVCGGGANAPYVDDIFSEPCWWKKLENMEIRYPISRLPAPENYDSVKGKALFQRMAVAYGLAQPIPELGEFILPKDCPDHTPPPLPLREEFGNWDGSGLNPTPAWLGR